MNVFMRWKLANYRDFSVKGTSWGRKCTIPIPMEAYNFWPTRGTVTKLNLEAKNGVKFDSISAFQHLQLTICMCWETNCLSAVTAL